MSIEVTRVQGIEGRERVEGLGGVDAVGVMPAVVVRKPDWVGRTVGLAVFCGGIVLLVLVFVWSSQLVGPAPAQGEKLDVNWAVSFGVNIVRLFVSGLVASWIAGRGAQLYAAANRALAGD